MRVLDSAASRLGTCLLDMNHFNCRLRDYRYVDTTRFIDDKRKKTKSIGILMGWSEQQSRRS